MTLATPGTGPEPAVAAALPPEATVYPVLMAVAFCHLLNDLMQALIPALYPLLKANLALDFGQIGLVTLVFQGTASLLQPLVGIVTDRRPLPFSLPLGMGATLAGLVLLGEAGSFGTVLAAVALIGLGSAVFHPESTRIARLAAGMRPGFAQSLFQVGGNAGAALGPLLAAFVVLPNGQGSVAWFAGVALLGMGVLGLVAGWFRREGMRRLGAGRARSGGAALPRWRVATAVLILVLLCFAKFVYTAAFASYFTFYVMERFGLPVAEAQVYLFVYLGAVAVGTFAGGPLGDRFGRKRVIWGSILGILPLAAAIPHLGLAGVVAAAALSGLVLASAFPAIVVYGQELLPLRVGLVAGLFFGLAFGLGGIGAALVGHVADRAGIVEAFRLVTFLPLLGLLAVFLPNLRGARG